MSMAYGSPILAFGTYTVGGSAGLITGADLSVAQTYYGWTQAGRRINASAMFSVLSGTPNGTFYLDASNDPRANDPAYAANAQWEPVQSSLFTAGASPSGTANALVSVINGMFAWRVRWVPTSGSGTGFCALYGVATA